jgi:hypothetical protein
MDQLGHTSAALEVYAKKMERSRETGRRIDELVRGSEWDRRAQAARHPTMRCQPRKRKRLPGSLFSMGGAGLEAPC